MEQAPPNTPTFSVDETAIGEARKVGLETISHPALWRAHKGYALRGGNDRLVADCDHLVVFWDLAWREIAELIDHAFAAGKLSFVYGPDGTPLRLAQLGEAVQRSLATAERQTDRWSTSGSRRSHRRR
jgi:hypothetical protein